ncbi:MAG: hypothetical protein ACKVT2_19490 [Saprospiraceae bacterium]
MTDPKKISMEGANYMSLILPVKTHEAISKEYTIDVRTLRRWCKREGLNLPSTSLSPKYQQLIYETFGTPPV